MCPAVQSGDDLSLASWAIGNSGASHRNDLVMGDGSMSSNTRLFTPILKDGLNCVDKIV